MLKRILIWPGRAMSTMTTQSTKPIEDAMRAKVRKLRSILETSAEQGIDNGGAEAVTARDIQRFAPACASQGYAG